MYNIHPYYVQHTPALTGNGVGPHCHPHRVELSHARHVLGVHSSLLTNQSLQKALPPKWEEQGVFLAVKYSLQSKMKPLFTPRHFRVFYTWI